jgi:hypothetical protein
MENSQKNIDDVRAKICKNPEIEEVKPEGFELIVYKVVRFDGGYKLQTIAC